MVLKNITPLILFFILSCLVSAPNITEAAVKKQTKAVKPGKQRIPAVPAQRVLRDLSAEYQTPSDSTIVKKYYLGNIRNYTETRGTEPLPAQSHQVALVIQLTDCGIRMRDTWEVYYYKLENEWIFQDIMQIKSTQLTKPQKKLPPLDDQEMKNLISGSLTQSYRNLAIQEITVLNKTGYWRLCTPMYRATTKIALNIRNDIYNTITKYECVFISILARQEAAWTHTKTSCRYRGKEFEDCHIGTFCLPISAESTIPRITDDEALSLLLDVFKKEYFLQKNNIRVEKFSLVKTLPRETYGAKIPCIINTRFVIDENREEIIREDGTQKRSYKKVSAVYECTVYAHLQYSRSGQKWEGSIDSCCLTENEPCSWPCSRPDKGCRRLGEK